jgi:hypothetical protein
MTAERADAICFNSIFFYLFALSHDAFYGNLSPLKVYRKLPWLFQTKQLPFTTELSELQLNLSKISFIVLHQAHFLSLSHIRTIISAYSMIYLKSI